MATRTLLLIIVKVLGLFFLRDALPLIGQAFSLIAMMNSSGELDFGYLLFSLIPILIYAGVAFVLLFNTGWVLEILKLEQGLENEVDVRINQPPILQMAVLVVGGLMLLTTIPGLLRQLYLHFQYATSSSQRLLDITGRPDVTLLFVSAAQIIIGLLLLNNHRSVAAYISWKTRP